MKKRTSSIGSKDLPTDILIDILSRLPVKSLLRFKSVSKTWYSLVEHSSFVSKYLGRSNGFLLVTTDNLNNDRISLNLLYGDSYMNLDFPFLPSRSDFGIVASVNGLAVLELDNSYDCCFGPLFLCNPATRKFRRLPSSKLGSLDYIIIRNVFYGFGFDFVSDDFKVVRVVKLVSCVDYVVILRAEVYTIRCDSWREIKVNLPDAFSHAEMFWSPYSVVVDGVLYWTAYLFRSVENINLFIVSFDMGNEAFAVTKPPPCFDGYWSQVTVRHVNYNDKLGLIVPIEDFHFELWVMNPDDRSWAKQFALGPFPTFGVPMGCGENGEMIFKLFPNSELYESVLHSCDPYTKEFKDLGIPGAPLVYDIKPYVESLLPVKIEHS